MLSVCCAWEQLIEKKLKRFSAHEFPQVKCKREFDRDNCDELTCKYFFYEDCEGDGCMEFILCDNCLNDENAIKKMLEFYDQWL